MYESGKRIPRSNNTNKLRPQELQKIKQMDGKVQIIQINLVLKNWNDVSLSANAFK